MAIAVLANPLDLTSRIQIFIGRHADKSFDWDAFPGSRGFPELERAQMRYIGAGGSPKADDRVYAVMPHSGAHSSPQFVLVIFKRQQRHPAAFEHMLIEEWFAGREREGNPDQ